MCLNSLVSSPTLLVSHGPHTSLTPTLPSHPGLLPFTCCIYISIHTRWCTCMYTYTYTLSGQDCTDTHTQMHTHTTHKVSPRRITVLGSQFNQKSSVIKVSGLCFHLWFRLDFQFSASFSFSPRPLFSGLCSSFLSHLVAKYGRSTVQQTHEKAVQKKKK